MKKIKYATAAIIILVIMFCNMRCNGQGYWGGWNNGYGNGGYFSPIGGYSYSYGGYGYNRGLTGLIVDLAVGIPLTIAQASLYSGCRVNVPYYDYGNTCYYDSRSSSRRCRTDRYREQRMIQVPVQVSKKFCRVIRYDNGSTGIDYRDCYYKTETSYEWVLQ